MVVDSWDELLSLSLIEIKKLYKDNFISTEKVMTFTNELLEKIKS
jgi:predicted transcriptional regulator